MFQKNSSYCFKVEFLGKVGSCFLKVRVALLIFPRKVTQESNITYVQTEAYEPPQQEGALDYCTILCQIILQNAPYKDYNLLVLSSFEVTTVTSMDSQKRHLL